MFPLDVVHDVHYFDGMNAKPSPAPPPALKADEAARQLGVSKRTVYYLVESGQLQALRHPGRTGKDGPISIEQAAIDAYKRRVRTPAPTGS